ncbi:MAG: HAD family hydrolase [Gemmatimonadota bacterium]|nr:HAD family hydrolase [Gemmatimonadota bacterium]
MSGPPTSVFVDRDGTIIRDAGYLSRPADVELLAGSAHAIRRLNRASIPVIVITNQSGIARGMFTLDDYLATQKRMDEVLAEHGAYVDATYFCPHHPDATEACECRKPGVALFERAIRDRSLNMRSPRYVGDRWRDIQMSTTLGGIPFLIDGPNTPATDIECATHAGIAIVSSLKAAVDAMLDHE